MSMYHLICFLTRDHLPVFLCLYGFLVSFASAQDVKVRVQNVVAVIDGVNYTSADIDRIRNSLPTQYKKGTEGMSNGAFLKVYGELLGFAKRAEEAGIPEQEPLRTQLKFLKLNFLAQAYLQKLTQNISVSGEDYEAYHQAHRTEYEERTVSAIYIDYSLGADKTLTESATGQLSENEARVKAKNLVQQLHDGVDFSELATVHSTDTTSAKNGGKIGKFKYDAKIPASLRDVIFSLKPGTFSPPLQQGGRFYIFHVDAVESQPLKQLRKSMESKIRAIKLTQKIDEIRSTVSIETFNKPYMEETPVKKKVRLSPDSLGTPVDIPLPPKPLR